MKSLRIIFGLLVFTVFVLNGLHNVSSFSGNAPEVLISIVKDGSLPTCNSCHAGGKTGKIPKTGGITITKQDQEWYSNNTEYSVEISIDTALQRHGLQVIALDTNLTDAGTFSESSDKLLVEKDAVENVSHLSHNNISNTDTNAFSFNWTSPSAYKGPITFHVIGVAANGDRGTGGDKVYYDTLAINYDANASLGRKLPLVFDIYPTLTSNYLNIVSEDLSQGKIEIVDLNGRVLLQEEVSGGARIELNQLNQGMYLARWSVEGRTAVKKFFVE